MASPSAGGPLRGSGRAGWLPRWLAGWRLPRWLGLRLSAGFRLLARLRFDFALILIWIRLDFGWISAGFRFGFDSGLV